MLCAGATAPLLAVPPWGAGTVFSSGAGASSICQDLLIAVPQPTLRRRLQGLPDVLQSPDSSLKMVFH